MKPRKCYIKQGDPDSERQKSHQFFHTQTLRFHECVEVHVSPGTGQEAGKEAVRGEGGIKEEGRQIVGSRSMRTVLEAAALGILT